MYETSYFLRFQSLLYLKKLPSILLILKMSYCFGFCSKKIPNPRFFPVTSDLNIIKTVDHHKNQITDLLRSTYTF